MHSDNFDISTYFKRINYTGPAAGDTGTLHALMRHQLFAIPFENLDVLAGKIVSLAPDDIADKLLTPGRGGYCYEVNGLFAMALEALGIPYRFVAARPMFYPVRRPKTHMALIAEVESRQWLCDLGFGSYGIRAPMALDTLDVDIAQVLTRSGLAAALRANICFRRRWRENGPVSTALISRHRSGLISFRPTTLTPRTRMPFLCRSVWWCSIDRRDARFYWGIC